MHSSKELRIRRSRNRYQPAMSGSLAMQDWLPGHHQRQSQSILEMVSLDEMLLVQSDTYLHRRSN